MTVPMDSSFDSSSRDRAQRLYNKNVELENRRRRSAQARIPSDPSIWHQMRENYEAIILEDYAFAEKHEVEYALWQLHYRRIEELRAHFNAAVSSNSAASQNGKDSSRPDRIMKIRSQFKSFLAEATGFYHDLMLKIRAKYGLPLGYFTEETENSKVTCKNGGKSTEIKKGLISCHRCLIYLGDLSRYKGLYGDGDSKARDFAAASSYYLQAASLWPQGGNPHHQLAILASYSGDELVAIYRYFRSLAVDNPFSTARDNLIIAFEKNRQNFTQLLADAKASLVKTTPAKTNGKGRGKAGAVRPPPDNKLEASGIKETASTIAETLRVFSIRFVRLNGILFTRTSLETFEDVFSMVRVDLLELLPSGEEEIYNFAAAAEDNGIMIVRIVAILIFTVHNVNRETENQSYAEILQRSVLLEHALTAAFEIMGLIVERCAQLHDLSSSFLLPGALVFLEWLACHPEIAAGSEVKEKQASARLLFWNRCISFLNKLMSSGFASMDEDADESCFVQMSRYDEHETANRLALWEDFELRGFLPLVPAQQILDFSRSQSMGSAGDIKEKKMRIERILSAGKALTNIVRVGHEGIYFDPKSNEFSIGIEPPVSSDDALANANSLAMPDANEIQQVQMVEDQKNIGRFQPKVEEEEDEVIVFRPSISDKHADVIAPEVTSEFPGPGDFAANIESGNRLSSPPFPVINASVQSVFDTNVRPMPTPVATNVSQQLKSIQPSSSQWLVQQQALLANGFNNLNLMGNGHALKPGSPQPSGLSQSAAHLFSHPQSVPTYGNEWSGVSDTLVPSKFDSIMSSGVTSDLMTVHPSVALPAISRKNPVSRPVRHLGPPPGFGPARLKMSDESSITMKNDNLQMDDYSWLDGYHLSGINNSTNHLAQTYLPASRSSSMAGGMTFPFPGKQAPVQAHDENQNNWKDYNFPGNLKLYQEQQQIPKFNQQSIPMPDQNQGQSVWESRFFV